jgi:hypothetical protein
MEIISNLKITNKYLEVNKKIIKIYYLVIYKKIIKN